MAGGGENNRGSSHPLIAGRFRPYRSLDPRVRRPTNHASHTKPDLSTNRIATVPHHLATVARRLFLSCVSRGSRAFLSRALRVSGVLFPPLPSPPHPAQTTPRHSHYGSRCSPAGIPCFPVWPILCKGLHEREEHDSRDTPNTPNPVARRTRRRRGRTQGRERTPRGRRSPPPKARDHRS